MSLDADALTSGTRVGADRTADGGGDRTTERQRLERLASEFESMLLVQVLRDMRRAGRWEDGEGEGGDAAGAESLFELIDVELATQFAKTQGFGLTRQMLDAYDRGHGAAPATADVDAVHDPAHIGHNGTAPPFTPGTTGAPDAASVTSAFGWRRDPLTGDTRFHRGVDLRAAYGQDVPAAREGTVVFSGTQGGYGTTVMVEHPDGTRTRYAHLSVALVGAGDRIAAGQSIGQAGSSGRATGPHVHFELLDRQGRPLDPMDPQGS